MLREATSSVADQLWMEGGDLKETGCEGRGLRWPGAWLIH